VKQIVLPWGNDAGGGLRFCVPLLEASERGRVSGGPQGATLKVFFRLVLMEGWFSRSPTSGDGWKGCCCWGSKTELLVEDVGTHGGWGKLSKKLAFGQIRR